MASDPIVITDCDGHIENTRKFLMDQEDSKNLGKDVVNNFKSVIAGNPINVEQDEAGKRKAICNGCEFFNKQSERCLKCGCYMAVKVYLKASHCPIGKW